MRREGERGRHPQQPLRRAAPVGELGLERRDLAHDPPRLLVEGLAVGGEMDCPRRALQQPHTQPAFQAGDELAHRRRRQPKGRCGSGKALRLHHPHEGFQVASAIDHCLIIE